MKRRQKLNTTSHNTHNGQSDLLKIVNKTSPGWIPGQFWTSASFPCRPLWGGSSRGDPHLQHHDPPHPGKVSLQLSVDFQQIFTQHILYQALIIAVGPWQLLSCCGLVTESPQCLASSLHLQVSHFIRCYYTGTDFQ